MPHSDAIRAWIPTTPFFRNQLLEVFPHLGVERSRYACGSSRGQSGWDRKGSYYVECIPKWPTPHSVPAGQSGEEGIREPFPEMYLASWCLGELRRYVSPKISVVATECFLHPHHHYRSFVVFRPGEDSDALLTPDIIYHPIPTFLSLAITPQELLARSLRTFSTALPSNPDEWLDLSEGVWYHSLQKPKPSDPSSHEIVSADTRRAGRRRWSAVSKFTPQNWTIQRSVR